jgi:hypothetical protein
MAAAAILGTAIGSAAVTLGRGVAAATGTGLSFAAELLKAAGGAETADAHSGDSALDELKTRISGLAERLRRHLAASGIRLSQAVELISNGRGGISLAGAHPQQAAIESALASDVLLESEFNRLALDHADANGGNGSAGLTVVVAPKADGVPSTEYRVLSTEYSWAAHSISQHSAPRNPYTARSARQPPGRS